MKVLHVVTLHSSDNAFGGPVRVALNLTQELQARGHEMRIVGLQRGFESGLNSVEGVPSTFFRANTIHPSLGFSGLFSFAYLRWLLGHVREYDVVHVHLARDLVTLPAALLAWWMRVPFVLQTHGMVDRSRKPLARVLDSLATRRVLRHASRVLHLTPRERQDLLEVSPGLSNLEFLPNGVPAFERPAIARRDSVVCIARLQARKRPTVFVEAAASLVAEYPDHRFVIAGPDEGELPAVREAMLRAGDPSAISYAGALTHDEVLGLLAQSAVYVLPSVDEPFPMSVLEALSAGVPCIVTDTCGLASWIERSHAGVVCQSDPEAVAFAISTVLADQAGYSTRAKQLADPEFSMSAVVDQLLAHYRTAASGH